MVYLDHMRIEPQRRKRLDKGHIALLEMLFRFRFATSDLLARGVGKKTGSQVYKRLRTLLEQEYIGRRYEAEYRLRGQSASYFLLSKGLRLLRRSLDSDAPQVLHKMHRDKTASDQFIMRHLALLEAYGHLRAFYDDRLQFFTKIDLEARQEALQPLPDALVIIDGKQFALEIVQDAAPISAAVRKIKQYAELNENAPGLLFVCDTTVAQQKLLARIAAMQELEQLSVYVTIGANLAAIGENEHVWFDPQQPDTAYPLQQVAEAI